MKLLIAGGRNYKFTNKDKSLLDSIAKQINITEEVSGCALGADTCGMDWAELNDIPIKRFPADWDKFGKSAGYKRNVQMAEYLNKDNDLVILFPGNDGTNMMYDIALKKKLNIIDFRKSLPDKLAIHPRTKSILYYNDEEHKYWTKDCSDFTSVTTFIDDFFHPFETEKIAGYVARSRNVSKKVVLDEWRDLNKKGCDLGTSIHLYCECFLKKLELPKPCTEQEKKCFKEVTPFLKELLRNFNIVESEKIIFSEDLKLSGTLDLLIQHKKQRNLYFIIDWKTNKKITMSNKYRKYAKQPIQYLADNNYNHYVLQLSLYKYLLLHEGYFTKDKTIKLRMVHITEDGLNKYKIPYNDIDIQRMITHYKNNNYIVV